MKYYTSELALIKAIKGDISAGLNTTIAPAVKDIITKRLQRDVYSYRLKPNGWGKKVNGVWKRSTYERRRALENNLISEVDVSDCELLVTSNALPNDSRTKGAPKNWFHAQENGAFFLLLERKNPGLWAGGFRRPVIRNAQREVSKNKKIDRAFKTLVGSLGS